MAHVKDTNPGPGMDKDRRVVVHTEFLFRVQAGGASCICNLGAAQVGWTPGHGQGPRSRVHAPSSSAATWRNQP